MALSDADRRQLGRLGIPEAEVERQLALFRRGRTYLQIVRPCTAGDGVRVVEDGAEVDRLLALHAEAAAAGRFELFVPASGAASRMFADLLRFERPAAGPIRRADVAARAAAGDDSARMLERFLERFTDLPFHERLRTALRAKGEDLDRAAAGDGVGLILDTLLGARGLACAERPKGLLEFHAYPDGPRTAFEEQLVEASHYVRDAGGRCRLHFTVSPEHRGAFESLLRDVRAKHERATGASYEVEFSIQKPSTDTLAADAEGQPLRDGEGRLVFRPGGHGSLIENLEELGGDLVYVKNIDNVQPDRSKSAVGRWKRILGGYLVALERRRAEILAALESPAPSEEILAGARSFAASRLHIGLNGRFDAGPAAARRAWLLARLRRPLRVCGVVRNTGEPGGGPFWVRGSDGEVSLQIVERAQLDPADGAQQRVFASATHFNPVDLVCALRDESGRPHDLRRFVDPATAIITSKPHAGREVLALERPGLWNGAMAGWITVFVEVPLETFAPVKTIFDLLRDEHRPGSGHATRRTTPERPDPR